MPTDINNVTHLVQMALTPAFLLSGIGAVLAVLSSRLSRIVDRSHQLEDKLLSNSGTSAQLHELKILNVRAQTIHFSLFFCTISAFCICAVVSIIYIGKLYLDSELTGIIVSWLFAISMATLTISLFLFLKEIRLCAHCIQVGIYQK
jgi:Protein of unknown function (DUF2721)